MSSNTITVHFVQPVTLTVALAADNIPADGVTPAIVIVTARDYLSNLVVGRTVTLVPNGGSSVITPLTAVTDASGVATFHVTNTTAPQSVNYSAT